MLLLVSDEDELMCLDEMKLDTWVIETVQALAQKVVQGRGRLISWAVEGIRERALKAEILRGEGWRSESAKALQDHKVEYETAETIARHEDDGNAQYLDMIQYEGIGIREFSRDARARHRDWVRFAQNNRRAEKEGWEEHLTNLKTRYEEHCVRVEQKRARITEQEREKVEREIKKVQTERGMNYMRVRNALILHKRDVSNVRSYLID
jgi:hypothetical protein